MNTKSLYRDTENGKIGGVCAGLAATFGAEVWLVRLLFVSLFLFTGFFLAILIYIIAWLLLVVETIRLAFVTISSSLIS